MVQIVPVTRKQVQADTFIVGVDGDRRAPGLEALGIDHAHLKRILSDSAVSLGYKTVRAVPLEKGWAVLVGLGDVKKLTQEKIGSLANAGARAAAGLGAERAATTLLLDLGHDPQGAAQAIAHGAVIGALDFDQWKSRKERREERREQGDGRLAALEVVLPDGRASTSLRRALKSAAVVAEAVNDARLLGNTPANVATPKWLVDEARKRGRKHGFKVSVKSRAALRREGFNAICAVGQGSVNEEQLITMDHHPAGAKRTIVVAGKGICFDSGGISIKPGANMWDMKYDKCGACNTIALMTTLKALKVKHRVVGIVGAAENMPSGTAQRPGDIITAKDGTTIEVLNTDAEGRLVLADVLAHGRTFKPDWMCDMATLTGACAVAVGDTYVAVLSKDDALAESFVAAARTAGDKAWRLPQGEEFDEANKGTYGDLQNISTTNKAGTCVGGSFVGHFAKDTPFVHLDIASKAWTNGMDYFKKGPTGAGLRIVLQRILDE